MVLLSREELNKRIDAAYALLAGCRLCPRECGVNRLANNKLGFCRSGLNPIISSAGPHFGEEPPISGTNGSGTIFFANCNLRCVYCQNYSISQFGNGVERTPEELAGQMLYLQEKGCHNLNLVTPTHFMPQILRALAIALERGFNLPIVYNTSGYDSVEALRLLDGIVDIYMPDMRYSDNAIAQKYSIAPHYTEINRAAVKEMYRQVGPLELDERGIAVRGLLIRHLVLPNGVSSTKDIMRFVSEALSPDVYISLMSQYFPAYRAIEYEEISRRLKHEEYGEAIAAMKGYGLEKGLFQGLDV